MLAQPLWKTVWHHLLRLKLQILHNPETPLLGRIRGQQCSNFLALYTQNLRISKSFCLCGLYPLTFIILEIKTEKNVKHRKMQAHIPLAIRVMLLHITSTLETRYTHEKIMRNAFNILVLLWEQPDLVDSWKHFGGPPRVPRPQFKNQHPRYIYTMELYSAIKKNEMPLAATWMNL